MLGRYTTGPRAEGECNRAVPEVVPGGVPLGECLGGSCPPVAEPAAAAWPCGALTALSVSVEPAATRRPLGASLSVGGRLGGSWGAEPALWRGRDLGAGPELGR